MKGEEERREIQRGKKRVKEKDKEREEKERGRGQNKIDRDQEQNQNNRKRQAGDVGRIMKEEHVRYIPWWTREIN